MIPVMNKSTISHIAAAVTIAAGAAAMYVERKRRKKEEKGDEITKPMVEKSDPPKEEAIAVTPEPVEPEAKREPEPEPETTPTTGNKKVVVLVTSYAANPNIKANQDRAMTILKGLKVSDDQMETIDGAAKQLRGKRNELFGLSGIRAKYPQFFVIDQNDQTNFLASWEDFEMMNEMGTLKASLNLA
uniref:Uncharacterized protein n=1 Tax=Pseudo-nitzschia delicatissima TaxID=44447 RepID=A0A7S0TA28_9STRA|mmetsp:Transcript_2150/g.5083  ORF Transcript_2150/g.5083 Transcript_2150/m.5083 type:complete len:187 (+) Transcript_2150:258-818(+)